VNFLLSGAYEGAVQLARAAVAVAPANGGKLLATFRARRGIRGRYEQWSREKRNGDRPLDSPEQNRFAAHEVKHMIFDFHVVAVASDNRYEVSPGTYTFAGGYGGVAAAHTQVILVSP